MFCPKCGNKVNDGEKFCSKCGTNMADAAAPQITKSKRLGIVGKLGIGIGAVVGILLIVLVFAPSSGNSGNEYIEAVKNATLPAYPQATVGEAFDNYLYKPEWETYLSDDKKRFVNVIGQITMDEKEANLKVQFLVEDETSEKNKVLVSYNACEIDGVAQSEFAAFALFDTIYANMSLSDLSDSENLSDKTGMKIGETKTILVADGEIVDVTFNDVEFTDGPLEDSAYNLTSDSGSTYLLATFTVKNVGTKETSFNTLGSTVIYDGVYEYTTEGFTLGDDLLNLVPLGDSETGTVICKVPTEVATSNKALIINTNVGMFTDHLFCTIREDGETLPENKDAGSLDASDASGTPDTANNSDVSNVVVIPEGIETFDTDIPHEEMSGSYADPYSSATCSLSMYSSPEDERLGTITIMLEDAQYSGEVVELQTNIYQVLTTDGTEIVFGMHLSVRGPWMQMSINGEVIEFDIMEQYIS